MKYKKEKNNRKQAIALRYESGEAPIVIAKEKGLTAEKIIKKATERGVPIQDDPKLVEVLSKLNLNEVIPEELYEVVAEIFVFLCQIDRKIGENSGDW